MYISVHSWSHQTYSNIYRAHTHPLASFPSLHVSAWRVALVWIGNFYWTTLNLMSTYINISQFKILLNVFTWFKETLRWGRINKLKINNPIFAYLDKNKPILQESRENIHSRACEGLNTLSRRAQPSKCSQERTDTVNRSIPQHLLHRGFFILGTHGDEGSKSQYFTNYFGNNSWLFLAH